MKKSGSRTSTRPTTPRQPANGSGSQSGRGTRWTFGGTQRVYGADGKNPASHGELVGMSRLLVTGAVLVVLFIALGGSAVLAAARDVPERVADAVGSADAGGQSGSQISGAEFLSVPRGTRAERVRGLLGEPEHTSSASVEGVEIECWTYGVAGATGAFQLCFANGKLSSRFRY